MNLDSEVYMVQRHSDGLIKIGRSGHLRKRLYNLKHLYGPVTLLLSGYGTGRLEPILHSYFRHLHVEGEWFRPEPELIEFATNTPTVSEFWRIWLDYCDAKWQTPA